ncbi:MAG: pyridoxal phosphate-dependent aminotransferase [Bdellovibrionales bacterium]|nr:pyridoxal phosphate-dependent aminotransferase [Bdellovibrionales bacterium]
MTVQPLPISKRARLTPSSPIRRLSHLAAQARMRGRSLYHLNIGQPDLACPQSFLDGLEKATSSRVAYEDSQGQRELIEAWTSFVNSLLGVETLPTDLLVTIGASEGLSLAFMACCDPGDEILIFDPTYANYIGFAALTGVHLHPLETRLEDNFELPERKMIEKNLRPNTRAILFCNPNNPTGRAYPEETLRMLLEICEANELFLIIDETYRELTFDGISCPSILQIAPNHSSVVVVDSLSKRFSLCGARLGFLYTTHPGLKGCILSMAQARLSAPSLEQSAAAHMLRHFSLSELQEVKNEYQRRRDALLEALNEDPSIRVYRPQGAFYAVAKLPIDDAEAFAKYLLEEYHDNNETVFLAPAAGFYMGRGRGESEVRMAFVLEAQKLARAAEIIVSGLGRYRAERAQE